jgi:hypothetical protein
MNEKILFCHIPKTGGTYFNSRLEKNNNYELYCHKILKYDIKKYKSHFKISVIRDPVKKIVSTYFYHQSMIKRLISKNILESYQYSNWKKVKELYDKYNIQNVYDFLNNFKKIYFNEIAIDYENLKEIQNKKQYNMFCYYKVVFYPQHWFICDNNENILVDKIILNANIDSELLSIFNIKKSNKLNTHIYSNDNYYDYVTEENIKDIKEIYEKDYKILFNL